MIFTSLTFRALGRTHIASEPCVAIAMLCFDSTVGFPWSVPVLTQQFDVESRSHTCTAPLHAPPSEREGRLLARPAAGDQRLQGPRERGASPPNPSPLDACLRPWPTWNLPGATEARAPPRDDGGARAESPPPPSPRHPGSHTRPLFAEAGHQTPAGTVLTLLSEPLLLPKLRS